MDSNFAEFKIDGKSTKDYVFIFTKATISHLSNFQSVIAFLIYEAKYFAIYTMRKKMVWLKYL